MSAPDPQPAASPPADARRARRFDLVAIDLDGTLLRSDKTLADEAVRAIRAAEALGVRVMIASARPPRSVAAFYRQLGLDTLQVNYNGALIHDAVTGRHVYHEPLPAELGRQIARAARRADPSVAISLEVTDRWLTDRVDPDLPIETAKLGPPDFLGPLEHCFDEPVTKLMVLAQPDRLAAVRAVIEREFAGQAAIVVSDHHLIQVVHPAVDKGAAMQRVAAHYGVAPGRVLAIGDAPNDVGMLRWAGLGVAVANAWPEARAAADVVVASNNDHGVAEALHRFVLGG